MSPFVEQAMPESVADPERYMARFKVSLQAAMHMARQAASEKLYVNDTYQVTKSLPHVVAGMPPVIHLAIIRHDQQPIRSWSDMQAIKNALVGEEYEAVEVYPAESRLVDMGHQYHLWVFNVEGFRLPFGWNSRMVYSELERT